MSVDTQPQPVAAFAARSGEKGCADHWVATVPAAVLQKTDEPSLQLHPEAISQARPTTFA